MANFRKLNVLAIAALALTVACVVLKLEATRALPAPPPQNSGPASGFLGAWCAQGDPTKHCSIGSNGVFLNFTNESGSSASGHLVGTSQNVVIADEWDFVKGTLSNDGSQINWSNGTYWTRCGGGGGGGGGRRPPNLDGTWYRSGDHSQSCYIRQKRKNLQLRNESGQSGSGSIDGRRHLTTNWSGTQIGGTLSPDGDTIRWDNGTSWSR